MKKEKFQNIYRLQEKTYSPLLLTVFVSVIFGILMQYSASNASMSILKKSVIFMCISLMVFFLVQNVNIKNITMIFGGYLYLFSFILIFLLLTPLAVESHGAKRWIQLFGIQFQVAEVVKISVILFEAQLVDKISKFKLSNRGKYIEILLLWIIGVVPTLMLLIISKDLSSSAVILIITFAISFVTSKKIWPHLLAAGGTGTIIIFYVRKIAQNLPTQSKLDELPFRVGRVAAWIDPERYAANQGYQILQSLYAIGSGGMFGKGIGKSMIKVRMPEAQNDMIFSIICEELGALGGIFILLMLGYIIYLIVRIAAKAETLLESTIALGIATHFAFQSIVNVGVCLNVIPNTGIGLPFISYGGTAIITQMVEIGMVTSISKRHCIAMTNREIKPKQNN